MYGCIALGSGIWAAIVDHHLRPAALSMAKVLVLLVLLGCPCAAGHLKRFIAGF